MSFTQLSVQLIDHASKVLLCTGDGHTAPILSTRPNAARASVPPFARFCFGPNSTPGLGANEMEANPQQEVVALTAMLKYARSWHRWAGPTAEHGVGRIWSGSRRISLQITEISRLGLATNPETGRCNDLMRIRLLSKSAPKWWYESVDEMIRNSLASG